MPDRKIWKLCNLIFIACLLLTSSNRAWAANATLTITGSEQQLSGGAWGSGNLTLSFNGFSETVSYAQFSSPASIASALASMFSRDYIRAGLCANASGATITFHLKGAAVFTPIDIQGPMTSFQLAPSGWPGQSSVVADTGTLTLTVNGTVASTTQYGYGATPFSVAAGLAAAVSSNSPVAIQATGDNLYLESKQTGSSSNYAYSLTAVSSNGFGQPSFGSEPASGNLEGGADQNSTGSTVYSNNFSYENNSNVHSYVDSVMGAWSFTYDNLNRLATANAAMPSAAASYYCWSYDSFGNRTISANSASSYPAGSGGQNATGCPVRNGDQSYTATPNSQNQYASQLVYDTGGNVTNDGKNQYLYDAEGRICAVKYMPIVNLNDLTVMIGYIYNAEGQRVAKGYIVQWSCDPSSNGFTVQSDYVIGPAGEQSSEVAMQSNGTMAWQHTNVYASGQLMATYDNDGLHFHLSDALGTRRVQVNPDGVVEGTYITFPYGDMPQAQSLGATEQHYTGKERDAESGNDYFGARYYASNMGRFSSPDDGSDQNALNPQSWNLYSYGRNNPLIGTDDDGRTYNVCPPGASAGSSQCTNIDDKTFEAEQKQDQANGVSFANGTITANGVTQGAFTHDPDIAGDPASNIAAMGQIGNQGMGAVNWFGQQMVLNVAGGVAAHGIGMGVEALLAARAARVAAAAEVAVDAEKIANGHAFAKHAGEFGGVTQTEFKGLVQETMANPSDVRTLSNGRTAYWSDSQQMVVIKNPGAADGGTAFRPTAGKSYFNNLR